MKHHLFFMAIAVLFSLPSYAQTTNNIQLPTSINNDGAAPDASAQLEVKSTTQGMLTPRMTTAQRNAINSPATGLLVFDTTTNSFWFYNGTAWADLSAADADWLIDPNGIYNNTDNVGIGNTPSVDYKLYARQNTPGPAKAAIRAYRIGSLVNNDDGGDSWKHNEVDAAINAFSLYTNNYSAAIYGASFLDFDRSAAIIGTRLNSNTGESDIFGALGYSDNYQAHYAGYFNGNVNLKKITSTDGFNIESNTNSDKWMININSSDNDFDFRYNTLIKAYISDGDGAYSMTSDRSLKSDIEYLGGVLPKLTQLKPAKYYYNSAPDAPQKSHGFIAQEVQAIFPELVRKKEGKLSLAYDDFAVLAVQAIKEQQEIIEKQAQQNAELEKRLEKLESLLLQKE